MINAPFDDCKTAALHLADSIQSFGAMLIIDAAGRICAASANSAEWLGQPPSGLLGRPAAGVLPGDMFDSRGAAAFAADAGPFLRPFSHDGQELMAVIHRAGDLLIAEIERRSSSLPLNGWEDALLARGLAALGATRTAEEAGEALMQRVAEITGYDRVMLYRFLPDWHGEVVAEICRPGFESYQGLHFPAGDIPANARRLYQEKRQRIIADVHAEPVPVLAAHAGMAVDLTHSQLRAVHPVHIQYLKNMGVSASFSVSLVVGGRLWGMVACHHFEPRKVGFSSRLLCERLAEMAAIHMGDLQRLDREQSRHRHHVARTQAWLELQALAGGKQGIATQLAHFRAAFAASGAWARLDGCSHVSGEVPDDAGLALLDNWLENQGRQRILARDRIDLQLEKHPSLVRFASGLLYVPLGEQDYLLLMRAEQQQNVDWAGRPPHAADEGEQASELTPRNSFQIWREQIHGHATPWQDSEVEAAGFLRDMLVEFIERVRLERLALTDTLTGLANRAMFERSIQDAIRVSLRDNTRSAVYMMDLDNFKPVNDTYGHAAGDALLVQVAQRLREQVRERDVVARLGGDEFAIIQFRVAGGSEIEAVAARLLEAIRQPYEIQGQVVEIGASIGIAVCPQHASEQHELLECADLAMYKVKNEGRNGFQMFDSRLLPDGSRPQSLRSRLAQAIERDALHFVYQPILHAATHRLWGLEAFARWRHPERGLLEGAELLALAEQHGLLEQFAHWELRQAVQQAGEWQRLGLPLVPLAIRLSAQQFRGVDLAARCAELAALHSISLDWLRLGVDDTILQAGISSAAEQIARLARQGVLVQIDHFGSSLVSLADLAALELDCLKIDGSLLLGQAGKLAAMLEAVARALDVPIVATLVESRAMRHALAERGFGLAQGYAVAPLLEADDVPAWLRAEGRPAE
ncbi:EAL domain-containing protein [Betaproteobacteria bacterium SCN2]|jgi:diguanylate cyclase (GGDEF)-like protein|nr:EAL domain-containing protein [Betaproteobacteria bacterium SCN2]